MSLVPADGLYRRRIFRSGRHASRRKTAVRLAVVVAGASLFLLPGAPTRGLLAPLLADRAPADTTSPSADAAPLAQPAAEPAPVAQPAAAVEPERIVPQVAEMAPTETRSSSVDAAARAQPVAEPERVAQPAAAEPEGIVPPEPTVDAAPPADVTAELVDVGTGEPMPAVTADTIAPSAPAERASSPPAHRARHPQAFVQLSYYSTPSAAHRGAATLRRMWQRQLAGMPLKVMPAEAGGKPIWRVVAGPASSREHAQRVCAVVHHAGRSCAVAVI